MPDARKKLCRHFHAADEVGGPQVSRSVLALVPSMRGLAVVSGETIRDATWDSISRIQRLAGSLL